MSQRALRYRSESSRSGETDQLIRTLCTLVELERGFRAACNAASARLEDEDALGARAVGRLGARSAAAITALSRHVAALGAVAPDEVSARRLLGNSADLIRHLPRSDRVLRALASATNEVDGAYRAAVADEHTPEDIRAALRALRAKLAVDRDAIDSMEHVGVTEPVASS